MAAKLIYLMLTSLDGYTEDERGQFGWATPDDDEVHTYVNELGASISTYLYGRKMYETMVYWETAHQVPNQPKLVLEWARQWQAAEKIVYSRTLAAPTSARTRLERTFDPEAVRLLKASAEQDLAVAGPELAAQALRAGLVDEMQLILFPVVVGGGKRFFPAHWPASLTLIEERRFANGVVAMRYAVGG
ncbi:dihydrofolate reductase family protein [Rhabdobacter roseus]|uniref:Dihydrofolate reductase n=1 Tax=Rhabdobacter roseus TaxID=1655419 RepID=A0A840U3B4_9BACT|nr:dihydrofolate reductase family protein [Rhabdobacter roseus]MBB5286329.1 dihydrofolate reductase [Rhabdobacter roseus]